MAQQVAWGFEAGVQALCGQAGVAVAGFVFCFQGGWPGLAPAGDLLSCTRKKGGKEGVLRSLGTAELTARLRRCVRTTAVSQTGCAGCAEGGCALTDTLLCGGALRLLRSFSGCVGCGE